LKNQDNPAIQKLKTNHPLTHEDISQLESILWGEVGTKEDYQKEYGDKSLGVLVREIVGLDMNTAKEQFSKYLTSANLNSKQIFFINQIVEYIVHNGVMMDLSVMQKAPFIDVGNISEVFVDISLWLEIRKTIEQINQNAIMLVSA
jgi:type I restriction enzyme R subunit